MRGRTNKKKNKEKKKESLRMNSIGNFFVLAMVTATVASMATKNDSRSITSATTNTTLAYGNWDD